MLRISGMTVPVGTLRDRTEAPDNALHFRGDGAFILKF